ncbi:MAG: hypothetical protein HYV09_34225 [Deltaproteobacteria bacterium]|nr:hypothetical protein [Deltaproteobacteria bacterium]
MALICGQCGSEVEGRFCIECGAPAPRPLLARPEDEEALVAVTEGGGEGTQVTVDPDEVFVGLLGGDPTVVLEPGRHQLSRPCDTAAFVKRTPVRIRVARETRLEQRGKAADARIHGTATFVAFDPAKLIAAGDDPRTIAEGALETSLHEGIARHVEEALHAALDRGEVRIDRLDRVDELLGWMAGEWYLPGTRVDLREIAITVAPLEDVEETRPERAAIFGPGARVAIVLEDGRRVPAVIERHGYVVRLPDGEQTFIPGEMLEQESFEEE